MYTMLSSNTRNRPSFSIPMNIREYLISFARYIHIYLAKDKRAGNLYGFRARVISRINLWKNVFFFFFFFQRQAQFSRLNREIKPRGREGRRRWGGNRDKFTRRIEKKARRCIRARGGKRSVRARVLPYIARARVDSTGRPHTRLDVTLINA